MKKSVVKSLTAYQLIRDGILSGEYLPGARLVLADLQKKFRLGQGPVRDALMRLDRSGLVENVPFKGAVVKSPPSLDEILVIYRTRALIEQEIAVAAMQKITTAKLNKLQRLINASKKDVDDPQKFFIHDRTFHISLYEVAGMPHLLDIIGHLNDHVDTFLNTHSYDFEYRSLSIEHHDSMLKSIHEKDAETLCEALRQNIQLGFDYVQTQLAAGGFHTHQRLFE